MRPREDFNKCKSRKDGLQGICKFCKPKRNRKWYEANRERKKATTDKWQRLNTDKVKGYGLKKYGITIEQYNLMLAAQNGVCAICKQPEKNKNLSVDHNHATGKVRALLCEHCNRGLGHFKDNPILCSAAATYLSLF